MGGITDLNNIVKLAARFVIAHVGNDPVEKVVFLPAMMLYAVNVFQEGVLVKYREYSYDQARLLPVSLKNQIQPGTIEHTINYLVDHEIDLSVFDEKY